MAAADGLTALPRSKGCYGRVPGLPAYRPRPTRLCIGFPPPEWRSRFRALATARGLRFVPDGSAAFGKDAPDSPLCKHTGRCVRTHPKAPSGDADTEPGSENRTAR